MAGAECPELARSALMGQRPEQDRAGTGWRPGFVEARPSWPL